MYEDLLGTKFTPHGRSKEQGFDCYGLAIEVLKRNGISVQDVFYKTLKESSDVKEIAFRNNTFQKLDKPQKNCIVMITVKGEPTHVAVYIGEQLIIHATKEKGVVIELIRHYKKRIEGYYKVCN
jgi:cell wall-associated NlpC family hydrolase